MTELFCCHPAFLDACIRASHTVRLNLKASSIKFWNIWLNLCALIIKTNMKVLRGWLGTYNSYLKSSSSLDRVGDLSNPLRLRVLVENGDMELSIPLVVM